MLFFDHWHSRRRPFPNHYFFSDHAIFFAGIVNRYRQTGLDTVSMETGATVSSTWVVLFVPQICFRNRYCPIAGTATG
jgi:hypothetical protein